MFNGEVEAKPFKHTSFGMNNLVQSWNTGYGAVLPFLGSQNSGSMPIIQLDKGDTYVSRMYCTSTALPYVWGNGSLKRPVRSDACDEFSIR